MIDEMISNENERIAHHCDDLCQTNGCARPHGLSAVLRQYAEFYGTARQPIYFGWWFPYLAGPVSINKMPNIIGLDRTTLVRNSNSSRKTRVRDN